jgi:type IV pilus assembly protein PilB
MIIKKKLGQMLIEEGLLTEAQLNGALAEHKKSGLKLGQYITRKGMVNENQIVQMLSRQLKIEKYDPNRYPLDMTLAVLIPLDTAQKHLVAPLRKKGRLLTVALPDPLDINTLDSVEIMTNCEVEPVVCTEREINQLINSLYGMQSGLGGILESMDAETQTEDGEMPAEQSAEEIKRSSLKDMAGEAPVVRLVNSILSQAVREGASDIHISPKIKTMQIRFRIDGKLHEVPSPPKSLALPIIAHDQDREQGGQHPRLLHPDNLRREYRAAASGHERGRLHP